MHIPNPSRLARLTCGFAISLALFTGTAGAVQVFNTGVSAAGVPLSVGELDPHWTIISGPDIGAPRPAVASAVYSTFVTSSDSTWIWAEADSQAGVNSPYTLRLSFELTAAEASSIRLSGLWAADNIGAILLNGSTATGTGELTLPVETGLNYQAFHAFSITGGFVAGLNALDFVVTDTGGVAGLNVSQLDVSPVPEPDTQALLLAGLSGLFAIRRRFTGKNRDA